MFSTGRFASREAAQAEARRQFRAEALAREKLLREREEKSWFPFPELDNPGF